MYALLTTIMLLSSIWLGLEFADRLVSPRTTKAFAQAAPLSKITYKEWPDHYHELHNEPDKADVIKTMVNWMNQELA